MQKSLTASMVFAGFEIRPSGSFCLDLGSMPSGYDDEIDATGKQVAYKTLPSQDGGGFSGNLDLLLTLNKNLGISAGGGYFKSPDHLSDKEVNKSNPFWAPLGVDKTTTRNLSYVPINAGLRMFVSKEKFTPYIGVNFLLAVSGQSTEKLEDTINKEIKETTTIYNPGIGFSGKIGCDYKISKICKLFFEVEGRTVSLSLKSSEITKDTINGVDQLPGMSVNAKKTVYKDDLTADKNEPFDANKPDVERTYHTPVNSLALSIGLALVF